MAVATVAAVMKVPVMRLMLLCLLFPLAGESKLKWGFEGKPMTTTGIGMEMLWCSPGKFYMGSPPREGGRRLSETLHEVTLTRGFHLGKYEVTQSQWEPVMGLNPSRFKGATKPVEQVLWKDAMEFCRRLTLLELRAGRIPVGYEYRLPTEAQWEYACRAGTRTVFGLGVRLTSREANFNGRFPYGGASQGPQLHQPTDVGSYSANFWGFFDMHGNVSEWCLDGPRTYPAKKKVIKDPLGPMGLGEKSERIYRGGAYLNSAKDCRSAFRAKTKKKDASSWLGFRVSLQPAKGSR